MERLSFTTGRTLRFSIPDSDNKFVLVVIEGDRIEYFTGFRNIGIIDSAFAESYRGATDAEIRDNVLKLYKASYFHWAWYRLDGTRAEEELTSEYIAENTDPEVIFDEWVAENYDINDFLE